METTKYESVFKNPEGFTQQEITQLRTKVIAFSRALVGRRLAIPVSDNLDLNYKKKWLVICQDLYLQSDEEVYD